MNGSFKKKKKILWDTKGKQEKGRITLGREEKSVKRKLERCDVTSGDKVSNHKWRAALKKENFSLIFFQWLFMDFLGNLFIWFSDLLNLHKEISPKNLSSGLWRSEHKGEDVKLLQEMWRKGFAGEKENGNKECRRSMG